MLPEIAKNRGLTCGIGGGWLTGILNALKKDDSNEIVVCFPYKDKIDGNIGKLKYCSFVEKDFYKYDKELEISFENEIKKENPDLVHIFGTEFPHTLAAVNACENLGVLEKIVVSIQGLVSVIAEHYYAGLNKKVIHGYTLRDFIKIDNVYNQRKNFIRRGQFEIKALQKVKHVIGRTEWDNACVKRINKEITYHYCNETLRDSFYSGVWSFDKCERYSIFVSQYNYSIKGFHKVIEAFSNIIKKYPSAKLYVTGKDILYNEGIKGILHKTYYYEYLKKQIKKYNLSNSVFFLGDLNEKEMKDRMLKSNVFVLSSSIENSSNSLGEAMILGVPSVASDVGGVKNFIRHGENGFIYPFEENYMLEYYIDKIFSNDKICKEFSSASLESSKRIFDKEFNNTTLLGVYNEIKNGSLK